MDPTAAVLSGSGPADALVRALAHGSLIVATYGPEDVLGDASAVFKRAFRLQAVEGATTFADLILRVRATVLGRESILKTLTGLSPRRNYDNAVSLGTVFTTDTVLFDIGANCLQNFCRPDGKSLDAGKVRMTVRNSCSATFNAVAGINSQSTGMCYCDSTVSARACAISTGCCSS
jgi:hypothetical protein